LNNAFATVRTVSNHTTGGSQFTSLQTAYTASSNGDTLLVEGTDIAYNLACNNRWEKSLVVIGIGCNPQKQIPKRAKFSFNGCQSDFYFRPGGSGSRFYGIEFISRVTFEDNQGAVNNVVFEDCLFTDFVIANGSGTNSLTINNCVFNNDNALNLYLTSNASIVVTVNNSIFDGYVEGNNSAVANTEFNHCLFLSTGGTQTFNNLYYATIRNCIFMNRFPTGSSNSSYLNNLCRVAGTFPPAGTGNTASGNFENTDPLFVNNPANTFYSTTRDYHLQAGSPVLTAANDGTQIGLHGGYTGFSEQLEVLINPIIRSMNILNTSVASNGTLNVQIQATKPDNN
jgi:hypothetical protein